MGWVKQEATGGQSLAREASRPTPYYPLGANRVGLASGLDPSRVFGAVGDTLAGVNVSSGSGADLKKRAYKF